ncbi:MAG: citrate/2-methylcitrate synthase [Chloroflexota bacterium]|nr:citrate/2-methylcitrate synthase [Chloroflexota bacterium]
MPEQENVLQRGLRNVYLDRTKSSFIDGKAGKLLYRGYNIDDLATFSSFEETCYLLIFGKLPNQNQLHDFESQMRENRAIPEPVTEIIDGIKAAHPMDVLRTAISALSAFDADTEDHSPDATVRKSIRLTSQASTIVTYHSRIRSNLDIVPPSPDLNHAGNFLYMLTGVKPIQEDIDLIDKDFILHADHGLNASAFTARVVASTRADIHAAITAGLSALKGPLHGGAAEGVMKMATDIGNEANIPDYISSLRQQNKPVMGFGHPVYKTVDPRSLHLREGARTLSQRKGRPQWFEVLETLIDVMQPYAKKGVHPNVDFWSGAVYSLLDIPEDLFISIFGLGRVPGWAAQVIEQYSANYIIRPRLQYDGPTDSEYQPIEQRT